MSDAPAPAAPAAPTNGTAPAPANGTETPAAKKTGWDFTKDGPLKYRVSGKERQLDDLDKVKQRLSYTDAVEEKAKTLESRMREVEPRLQKFDGLKKAPPRDFWKGLSEEFGEEAVAKAAEEYFLERIAREEKEKALSPEAKRYKEDLERMQAEKARLEDDVRKRDEETASRKHAEETQQVAGYLNEVIGEAVADIPGLKPEAAAYFMPHVAASLVRAAELGLDITPQVIARDVQTVQHDMAVGYLSNLTPEGVVDLLEAIALKGEDGKPGGNMRKAAMLAWHARSQKKPNAVDGETPPQEPRQPETQPRAARRPGKPTSETWAHIRSILRHAPEKP